jgi:heptosyltransferase-2
VTAEGTAGYKGKILVVRGGAIGDFILTLPALSALRRQFPGTRLEVLGYPHIVQLALRGGIVHAVRCIEARSLAGFFARGGQLDAGLSNYFAEFALIISYLYDPDKIFQENIARASRAQFIAGPHRPVEHEQLHATQVFLKPLERLAIFDVDVAPRLEFSEPPPTTLAGGWLAVHPGSGSESKNWLESKWAELLKALTEHTKLNLLLVGGEAEGARLERLMKPLPTGRAGLAKSLPLADLAQMLRQCVAFVGHDSGISHLAAAVGLPTLVLWSDTAEAVWRPRNKRVRVLREPMGLHRLPVERVLLEVREIVGLA